MFKLIKKLPEAKESGYTILESIIAMLIVAVLMSVVAPVIGLSVGTRVSAKRMELASQAARSYIDWVRADTCKPGTISDTNCRRSPQRFTSSELKDLPAPVFSDLGTIGCTVGIRYCRNATNYSIFCVDGDGDGLCTRTSMKDMIIQATSYSGDWRSSIPEYYKGYELGIRVYRADAFNATGTANNLRPAISSTSVNSIGGDRRYPLITLTTEISPTENSFDNTKNRLCEQVTPRPASCPSP